MPAGRLLDDVQSESQSSPTRGLEVFGKGPNPKKLTLGAFLITLVWLAGCSIVSPERPVQIAFTSDRDGDFEIFLMDVDGSNLTNLTDNEESDGVPNWSSIAEAFVYLTTAGTDSLAIQRMDIKGQKQQVLINDPPANAGVPIWSPTGEWIVFGSGGEKDANIYLMDANGANLEQITDNPGRDRFVTWSPGGMEFLYTSVVEGSLIINKYDLNSKQPQQLTGVESTNTVPAWSPDGSVIAFVSDRDIDFEIYLMDANGNNQIRLTESEGLDGFPKWSPDGNKIGFVSRRDGDSEIYVMNVDGSEQINLTNNPAKDAEVGDFAWSPDGSQILFHSNRSGDVEIYVMNADGESLVNVSNNPASDRAAIWVP